MVSLPAPPWTSVAPLVASTVHASTGTRYTSADATYDDTTTGPIPHPEVVFAVLALQASRPKKPGNDGDRTPPPLARWMVRLTTCRTFTRERRCTLKDDFRIV